MITIITVVFNGEKTIRGTIESVCNQTLTPEEYLIIDGMSTDKTVDIVKEYMQQYSFIKLISEKDSGIYDAMNKGIALASGQLIGILNSDDWYEQGALEKMADAFKLKGTGVYYGIVRYIRNEQDYFLQRISQNFVGERMIPHPTAFVSKDVYERYGYYDLKYKYSSDLEWVMRLAKNKVPFRHLDNIITNFREGGASESLQARLESLHIRKSFGYINFKQFLLQSMSLRIRLLLK